ncbi:helix-turn-helix domain-containing protein [Sphingomonas sp. RB3P16]|uniref:helix-turn-helix domain-containing protein n=1 Tax=Parasphingomonas frigoris TaxID=3096163 RepID=UPI002FCA531F
MNALTVDTEEAARHLSLKPNTLEKMRTHGTGPRFVKLGRVVRYRIADLEAYIAERVVSSTSEKAAA